jgi:hypothetical protein
VALLEIFAAAYSLSGLSWSHFRPEYWADGTVLRQGAWRTEEQPWGAWHVPNARTTHVSSCFLAHYRANRFGARDRERTLRSSAARTVVLGDSFAEGWGVERQQRLTDRLEARTGREFLNFGSALNFGPLQYQILYAQLAHRFDHDDVLVLLLPDNDFIDNDLALWEAEPRHRPLYGAHGRVVYASPTSPSRAPTRFERVAVNFWSYGIYLDARYAYEEWKAAEREPRGYVGYRDPTPAQIEHVLGSLRAIRDVARDRRVRVVLIPRLNDLRAARDGARLPIPAILRERLARDGLDLLDLLPTFAARERDWPSLFLPCDGIWTPAGHALASDVVYRAWYASPKGAPR